MELRPAESITAHVVHERDHFEYEYGLTPVLRHKPALRADRGAVIAVYAAAVMKDGRSAFVVLARDEVEAIRQRSAASGSGPWRTNWDAMVRKTAVRQLPRWLLMSTELTAFQRAAAMDESVRGGAPTSLEDAARVYVGQVLPDDEGDAGAGWGS